MSICLTKLRDFLFAQLIILSLVIKCVVIMKY